MANYDLKINLAKMFGTTIVDFNGKKSIVIPIEENSLFLSEKTGAVYMDMSAIERGEETYGQTHYIKAVMNKNAWKKLPEDSRKAPIVGNMSPSKRQPITASPQTMSQPSTTQSSASFSDNLPF